ncbi:hypothetical protein AG1IA_03702 [Rhizoctonia solani AG-1 IA]|uniref:Uncharacterized protein n=1 Tax=Thanatephorus cucumeris (strain AG1-IA) TaxID=983506 RepID=L8X0Z7_THACA|nr:hypothetical protein AG1IA_03702 [Rhizoctonia solani AG-1 IA]
MQYATQSTNAYIHLIIRDPGPHSPILLCQLDHQARNTNVLSTHTHTLEHCHIPRLPYSLDRLGRFGTLANQRADLDQFVLGDTGIDELSRLDETGLGFVYENKAAGTLDKSRVAFAHRGRIGAYKIHMRALFNPCRVKERLGGRCCGAYHVPVSHGRFDVLGARYETVETEGWEFDGQVGKEFGEPVVEAAIDDCTMRDGRV